VVNIKDDPEVVMASTSAVNVDEAGQDFGGEDYDESYDGYYEDDGAEMGDGAEGNDGTKGYNFMFGDEGQNLRQIELPDPKDGRCVLCGKQFSNMQNARRHVREMHGGEKRSFDCQLCGMVFTRQRNFKEHMTRFHH